jgi:hypothetical protein
VLSGATVTLFTYKEEVDEVRLRRQEGRKEKNTKRKKERIYSRLKLK